jgi:hypothetical protein
MNDIQKQVQEAIDQLAESGAERQGAPLTGGEGIAQARARH